MSPTDYAVEALGDYRRVCDQLGGDILDEGDRWLTAKLSRLGRLVGLDALDRYCAGKGGVRRALEFEGARRAGASDNDLIGMAERRMSK